MTLETVIRGMKTIRELQSQSPGDDSKRLAKSLQAVQQGALSLHAAITSGWTIGCHAAHKVMLNLRSSTETQNHKLKSRWTRKNPIMFQMFISAHQDETNVNFDLVEWYPVSVLLQQDNWDDEPSSRSQALPNVLTARSPNHIGNSAPHMSRMPAVKISSTSFLPGEPSFANVSQPVTDMCLAIRNCSMNRQSLSLRLATGRLHMPDFRPPAISGHMQAQAFTVDKLGVTNLSKFLSETSKDEDRQMGFLERTELAVSIAKSLLSYHSTQWLDEPWTKESVHFFLKGQSHTLIDTSRPVIIRIVSKAAQDSGPLPVPKFSEPKSALLELAILLLELWHHRTLEDWAAQTRSTYKSTIEDRRIAATRWLEGTSNRLTTKYTSAIEACLAFCAGRIRSWQEDEFQRQICEDIIKPLKDNCKAW